MSQSNQPSEPTKGKQTVNNIALYSVGAQVGCATLLIVFLAVFIGIGLDKVLDTKPLFTIMFVLGSAPLSLFLTFWIAKRAVNNINPQVPVAKLNIPMEEEEKRE